MFTRSRFLADVPVKPLLHRTKLAFGNMDSLNHRMRLKLSTGALGLALMITISLPINSQEGESRWEPRIKQFEEQDTKSMPPEGAVLFVGSSSIVFWSKLAEDMAPLAVINRGFGGSQMHELNEFRDRIVTNYKPRAIMIYEGDNDIAAGKTPDEILATYDDFIQHIDEKLPETDICFIAIKPSIRREEMWPQMEKVNSGLRDRAQQREDLCYLDIATPMMKGEEFVRPELFVGDGLHLNRVGYEVWAEVIRPILVARYGSDSKNPATMQEPKLPEKEAEDE